MNEETRRWLEEYYKWVYGQGSKGSQGKSGKYPHPPPSWFQSPSESQSPSGLSLPPPEPPVAGLNHSGWQPVPGCPCSACQQYWSGHSVSPTYPTYLSRYTMAVGSPLNQAIRSWADDYVAKNRAPDPEPIKKTGPIVGFRAWEIETDTKGPRLGSTGRDGSWWEEGKDLRAACGPNAPVGSHDSVPGYHCTCGFYARRSLSKVSTGYNFNNVRFAFGAALLWGRLVAHYETTVSYVGPERTLTGWRAEWARPLALLDTAIFQDNPDLPKLSERYQIPVLDRRSLLLYCSEYGEIV